MAQFKRRTTELEAGIGDGDKTLSHYHLAPEDWEDLPGGAQRLRYGNEIPTKTGRTYLAFDFDLAEMKALSFRCNDRTFDMSTSSRSAYRRCTLRMLNFCLFAETDSSNT